MRQWRGARFGVVALVVIATSLPVSERAVGEPGSATTIAADNTTASLEVELDSSMMWAGGQRISGTVTITDPRFTEVERLPGPELTAQADWPVWVYSLLLSVNGVATLAPELPDCSVVAGRPCGVLDVTPEHPGVVRFSVIPPAFGAGAGEVVASIDEYSRAVSADRTQARWERAATRATAPYEVRQPSFEVMTAVAAQGGTVLVHGTGLPPDATIEFDWNPGIIPPTRVRTDDDDEVWWSLALDPHDTLGLRQLVVTTEDFAPNVADQVLLVVPVTGSPPTRNRFQR